MPRWKESFNDENAYEEEEEEDLSIYDEEQDWQPEVIFED